MKLEMLHDDDHTQIIRQETKIGNNKQQQAGGYTCRHVKNI